MRFWKVTTCSWTKMLWTSKEFTTIMCLWIPSTPTSLVKKITLRECSSSARTEAAILLIQILMVTWWTQIRQGERSFSTCLLLFTKTTENTLLETLISQLRIWLTPSCNLNRKMELMTARLRNHPWTEPFSSTALLTVREKTVLLESCR